MTRKTVKGKRKFACKAEREETETGTGNVCAVTTEPRGPCCKQHQPSDPDLIRRDLLSWYDVNKRDLPWRKVSSHDINQRAYAVWVSEIMLQQTQVATVIDYYNKWMKRWPTLQHLAKATLEEVNEMWAGLGYYSRGRRLHEGAKKVVEELGGEMPSTAETLLKQLPGVGKYTAGAIASIAFNEVTGLVDGNVVRVFARLFIIGGDSTSQMVTDTLWSLANTLVDLDQPGNFNQALMELGATVCNPKTPSCSKCPLKSHCKAYSQVIDWQKRTASRLTESKASKGKDADFPDIENASLDCKLCLPSSEPWDSSLGVTNYPRKSKKKAPREEQTPVCIVQNCKDEYLIVQRPKTGLLAGLWEFPSATPLGVECDQTEAVRHLQQHLHSKLHIGGKDKNNLAYVGEVKHLFSHISQTYVVYQLTQVDSVLGELGGQCGDQCARWVDRDQLMEAAISTAMKKVFKTYEASLSKQSDGEKNCKVR
ncbi:adenine DNA glycosylase-like [Lingula anatina]|uniref:Adenine DNA glycosylase n=1 Tax=Lingula anatina TaxID=7574 RepID=A0A1S3J8K4_LINAN|nr:adenine DNA glycosylase-like [Lingula anatina]|eukprot:XP_013406730.1 adenine DNA glycosylase-like [Lingula anatina]